MSTSPRVIQEPTTGLLHVNGEFRVSVVLCRYQETYAGSSRWLIRLDESLHPEITIAARMAPGNKEIQDYYLLPAIDLTWGKLRLAEQNGFYLDTYRFEDLAYFTCLAERINIEEVA